MGEGSGGGSLSGSLSLAEKKLYSRGLEDDFIGSEGNWWKAHEKSIKKAKICKTYVYKG